MGSVVKIVFRPHPEVEKLTDTDDAANDTVNDAVNKRQQCFLQQLASGKHLKGKRMIPGSDIHNGFTLSLNPDSNKMNDERIA